MRKTDSSAKLASIVDDSRTSATFALAETYLDSGNLRDAMQAYLEVLALQPRHTLALHRMGLAHFRDGDHAQARIYLERALEAEPERAEIWEHRGLVSALAGEYAIAEAFYCRALALCGGSASLHRNLADVQRLLGRSDDAFRHYLKALEFEPALYHAVRRLADLSLEAECPDDAANYLRRAWGLGASRLADGIELLRILARLERTDETSEQIEAMRAAFRTDASALYRLACELNELRHFNEAYEIAKQGLTIDGMHGGLHHEVAYASDMLGKHAQGKYHGAEAARLAPDDAPLQFNHALSLLRAGDFEAGWRLFDCYYRLPSNGTPVRCAFPEWSGEPVAGRRFLLVGEQGLGDQIQFLRCATWLQRCGAAVDVWVDDALKDVAAGVNGVNRVWTSRPPGPYDYWCNMLRFPGTAGLSLDMLPLAMPYISAPPDAIVRWNKRLAVPSRSLCRKLCIGLVWAGNPNFAHDRYRSIALSVVQPLFALHDVSWFSLQMGSAQDDLEKLPAGIDMTALGPEIVSFTDTLAMMQSLDLVIAVDTSVAHLAGAAGVPVWILLPACSDWRWMTGRNDTPWYPSARLFRQRELGRWDDVIEEVSSALSVMSSTPRASTPAAKH